MKAKEEKILFKDRIKKRDYPKLIAELNQAIDNGEEALRRLLLGKDDPDLYENHGKYKDGQHNRCGGLKSDTFTEKRLCKCFYYLNGNYCCKEDCENCGFVDRYEIVGAYKITDYERPPYYYVSRVGNIDLVLNDIYATEVKPYRGNREYLLRMVAEILTYTLGFPEGKYKKAIAFFEDTPQAREYKKYDKALMDLMKKVDITVFCFEKRGENTYEICKL